MFNIYIMNIIIRIRQNIKKKKHNNLLWINFKNNQQLHALLYDIALELHLIHNRYHHRVHKFLLLIADLVQETKIEKKVRS